MILNLKKLSKNPGRKKMLKFLSVMLLILLLSSCSYMVCSDECILIKSQCSVNGETYWVDATNTKGPWDGSKEYPFKTIQDAIDKAGEDVGKDTIMVKDGIYNENLYVYTPVYILANFTTKKPIINTSANVGIFISADNVNISSFVINSMNDNTAIQIISDINGIENNIFQKYNREREGIGIQLIDARDSKVIDNQFLSYQKAIELGGDSIVTISNNNYQNIIYDVYHAAYIYRESETFYGKISDALTSEKLQLGDVVQVKCGTYYEKVDITENNITLNGEKREETIIDGENKGDVIYLGYQEYVTIQGFTIKNCGNHKSNAGISVANCKFCNICNNILEDNIKRSIYLDWSDHIAIFSNIINKNNIGIYLLESDHNLITLNKINENNGNGVVSVSSEDCYFMWNDITGNGDKSIIFYEDTFNIIPQMNFIRFNNLEDCYTFKNFNLWLNNWWGEKKSYHKIPGFLPQYDLWPADREYLIP